MNNNLFDLNINNIQCLNNITNDSYSQWLLDNTFCIFKASNNILYLIYSNKYKSIISYNLINNKKINEVKCAHESYITNIRYFLDKKEKKDLIMSISGENNNIKLWNIKNFECLSNIKNINKGGYLHSACFLYLYYENQNFILTSNCNWIFNSELIKLYDLNGNKMKEIEDSNDRTFFIDTYYDNKLCKNYIITGNYSFVKSYDIAKIEIYHKYYDDVENKKSHNSVIINDKEDFVKLIESCDDGNIRIWNFHTGLLINKIYICNNKLCGICSWNDVYLFVGCKDKKIRILDLNKGKVIKELIEQNHVLTIKKIIHPLYGKCLISQGWHRCQIKLWKIEK